jgi:hypothetical protein
MGRLKPLDDVLALTLPLGMSVVYCISSKINKMMIRNNRMIIWMRKG